MFPDLLGIHHQVCIPGAHQQGQDRQWHFLKRMSMLTSTRRIHPYALFRKAGVSRSLSVHKHRSVGTSTKAAATVKFQGCCQHVFIRQTPTEYSLYSALPQLHIILRKFPGGLVVRIRCFHCRGPVLNTVRCMTQSQTNKSLAEHTVRQNKCPPGCPDTLPGWKYPFQLE